MSTTHFEKYKYFNRGYWRIKITQKNGHQCICRLYTNDHPKLNKIRCWKSTCTAIIKAYHAGVRLPTFGSSP